MVFYLVLGLTLGFSVGVQPGPLMAYLVSQALTSGWRKALPAAAAPLLSDGPIAVLVLLVLVRVPAGLVHWLRIVGGAFLLVLAAGAARNWLRSDAATPAAPVGERGLLKAATVNLLNPGPYLGWSLIVGPLLLKAWHEAPARGVALVAAFYGAMIATNAAVVLVFHLTRALGPRVNRAMVGVSALGLAAFGVWQLAAGVAAR